MRTAAPPDGVWIRPCGRLRVRKGILVCFLAFDSTRDSKRCFECAQLEQVRAHLTLQQRMHLVRVNTELRRQLRRNARGPVEPSIALCACEFEYRRQRLITINEIAFHAR